MAQIRLLQSSCKNCVFWSEQTFVDWYWSAPTLTEEERSNKLTYWIRLLLFIAESNFFKLTCLSICSYRLSNEIEAPSEPSPRVYTPTVIITECAR